MFLTETGLAKVFQRVRSFVASQLNSKASVIHTHTSSDITDLYNLIYPIGSIYLSVNSVDPSTLFGGTWEKIKDKFLLSDGDTYSIGSTGGEATHTLTIDEMPSHNHSASTDTQGDHTHDVWTDTQGNHYHGLYGRSWSWGQTNATESIQASAVSGYWGNNALSSRPENGGTLWGGSHAHNVGMNGAGSHAHTVTVNNSGAGAAHNNMPPYLTVNVWKRIA